MRMSITIKPVGLLKQYLAGESSASVEPGPSVREIMTNLGIPSEMVALVLVADSAVTKDYIPEDGDVVQLLAIIGGG